MSITLEAERLLLRPVRNTGHPAYAAMCAVDPLGSKALVYERLG